jgi:ribonuclease G
MAALSDQCPYCNGLGRVVSRDTMATKVERWFMRAKADREFTAYHLVINPELAEAMVDNGTDRIARLMKRHRFKINVVRDTTLPIKEYKVYDAATNQDVTERYVVR